MIPAAKKFKGVRVERRAGKEKSESGRTMLISRTFVIAGSEG